MVFTFFLANLPYTVTDAEIKAFLTRPELGLKASAIRRMTDKVTGAFRGKAFVTCWLDGATSPDDLSPIISQIYGEEIQGRGIHVEPERHTRAAHEAGRTVDVE